MGVFVPPRDRVAEISTSSGPTVFTVAGAGSDNSHHKFSDFMSVGDFTIGGVVEPGLAYKTGIITYSATNEITVTTVKDSINVGSFSASGPKKVFMGLPALSTLLVDGPQALTVTQKAQARANLSAPLKGHLYGLGLSTAGSSSSFSIAAGEAADSTGVELLVLASAISKTTGGWLAGSGNGALDVGTIANGGFYFPYLIARVDTGGVDALVSLAPGSSSAVTISNASPAQVSWTDHGLQANAPFVPTTTGTLPAGLAAGTQYFVKTVIDANTFTISATQGGAAINTSSAGSGTHTGSSLPILPSPYTLFRRLLFLKTDGSGNWLFFAQNGDTVRMGVPTQEFSATNPGTSAVTRPLTGVPPGIVVEAILSGDDNNASTNHFQLFSALAQTDTTPSSSAFTWNATGTGTHYGGEFRVTTNRSAQIRQRQNASGVSDLLTVVSKGCVDRRGRDA